MRDPREEGNQPTKEEQAGMGIVFQAELDLGDTWLEKQQQLVDQNMSKAYSLIFSQYCNKSMRDRIEQHPDLEATIRDDPIELLTKIKMLMHDPIKAKYSFTSLTKAMIRMLNIKQLEQEGQLDYIKRLKQSHDTTKFQVGTDILGNFMENTCLPQGVSRRSGCSKATRYERCISI